MQLSVVTTMYRSAPYLRAFYERTVAAAAALTDDFEIVFVNDGSPDESLAIALELQGTDPRVRVVDLSRNFGHHQAIRAGLQHVRGDWVFLIDCDLEEAPEWLGLFADHQRETAADVVYGVQDQRSGRLADRWGGYLYYKLFNAVCDVQLPENLMTVRLMSRRFIEAFLAHAETSFSIAALWALTGFVQTAVPLPKQRKRTTTYNLARRARLFVHGVTSFSNKPLVFIFYLGTAIVTVSALVAVGLVVARLCFDTILAGWPSLMVSIWMLGGLIIFCQGVQGLYLAKIYLEAKRRPIAIVRQVYEGPREKPHASLRLAR